MSLTYHAYPGHRVPFDPNRTMDDAKLAHEAQSRRQTVDAYVAERLAYRWPDGSPAYTQDGSGATVVGMPVAPLPSDSPAPTAGPEPPKRKKP